MTFSLKGVLLGAFILCGVLARAQDDNDIQVDFLLASNAPPVVETNKITIPVVSPVVVKAQISKPPIQKAETTKAEISSVDTGLQSKIKKITQIEEMGTVYGSSALGTARRKAIAESFSNNGGNSNMIIYQKIIQEAQTNQVQTRFYHPHNKK